MKFRVWLYRQSLSGDTKSISYRLRKKRMDDFQAFYENNIYPEVKPDRVNILDLGGEAVFWNVCSDFIRNTSDITMLNLETKQSADETEYFRSKVGDATDLSQYKDKSIDLVFSNSVIEHVGGWEKQKKMANEMMRVGRHIYIQTPNFFFPIEPHFAMFFVQFMPKKLRIKIVEKKWNFTHEFASDYVNGIELLSYRKMKKMFPGCKIHKEHFGGLTKSFIIYY